MALQWLVIMAEKNQVAYKVDLKRPENQNSLDNLLGNMPKKKNYTMF